MQRNCGLLVQSRCKCCSTQHDTPRENPYVVLQTRQELNAWPATDGQCWKADLGRGEQLLFVDGGALPVPPSDDKPHWRNAVLAAMRIELDVTGSFEKIADQVSFRTTDSRWLDLWRLSASSPEISVSTPLSGQDLGLRTNRVALMANHLRTQVDPAGTGATPLRELLEALQMDPSPDDAYRRLWYLRLHDRCRRLIHSCGRKIKTEQGFEAVNGYRNAIAHEGIEKINPPAWSTLPPPITRHPTAAQQTQGLERDENATPFPGRRAAGLSALSPPQRIAGSYPSFQPAGGLAPGVLRHHGTAVPSAVPHNRQVRNISPGNRTRPGWLETALFTAPAGNSPLS